ncbi:MAG TPA: hypothetical protein VNH65_03500 [Candidatus Acidoferrum sp.]|nr:hypothetical protein [Candidatus Acidoferrum sp.]
MKFSPANLKNCKWVSRGAGAAALALSLSGLVLAQQEPPPDQADRPAQSQQAQPQDQQVPPQQDGNRPPTSVDRVPRNSPPNGLPNAPQSGRQYGRENPGQYPPQNAPPPNGPNDQFAPPPELLTIAAGTVLMMRLNEPLSSDHNQVGDQFSGVLEQPIVVNGWVVARRGQVVLGQVKSVQKAGRIKGVSQLGVELTDLTLVNGEQAPILTELWKGSGGTSHGEDAATIGGGTALGAIIGSAADWGRGAAIGAGAGAAAGIGAVLLTRGRPTILEPEFQLSFRLVDPVKVNTTHSQQAFLPVSQEDFGSGRGNRPRLRTGAGYYGGYGPYAPCGYYYPCYYGPRFVGVYSGFGWWGPGYYGRGYYGRRGLRRY